ncbi:carboxylesterase family protein [Amycolatopsis lurida]
MYDAGRLAATNRAVVVTVNYRLGLLGSLAHPALDGPGGERSTPATTACRTSRRHCAGYGPTPARSTKPGQRHAAGRVSRWLQHVRIASLAAAGLFQRAVIQSARCGTSWATSRQDGRRWPSRSPANSAAPPRPPSRTACAPSTSPPCSKSTRSTGSSHPTTPTTYGPRLTAGIPSITALAVYPSPSTQVRPSTCSAQAAANEPSSPPAAIPVSRKPKACSDMPIADPGPTACSTSTAKTALLAKLNTSTITEIVRNTGRDPGTVLHHVRQLTEAGLLEQAPAARWRSPTGARPRPGGGTCIRQPGRGR